MSLVIHFPASTSQQPVWRRGKTSTLWIIPLKMVRVARVQLSFLDSLSLAVTLGFVVTLIEQTKTTSSSSSSSACAWCPQSIIIGSILFLYVRILAHTHGIVAAAWRCPRSIVSAPASSRRLRPRTSRGDGLRMMSIDLKGVALKRFLPRHYNPVIKLAC